MSRRLMLFSALGAVVVVIAVASHVADPRLPPDGAPPPAPGAVDGVALTDARMHGFDIAVPDWERISRGTGAAGKLELTDPEGGGRHMELRWLIASPLERSAVVELYGHEGTGLGLRESSFIAVAGSRVERLVFEDPEAGKRVAVTQWTCPDDPRAFTLVSFLNLQLAALVRLHDRVLASFRCGTLPPGNEVAIDFPRLAGATPTAQQANMAVYSLDGTDYVLAAVDEGPGFESAFMSDAFLRRKLVDALELEPHPSAFSGTPERVGQPARSLFRGSAYDRERAADVPLLLTLLSCSDRFFVGVAVPEGAALSTDAASRLGNATCPAASQPR